METLTALHQSDAARKETARRFEDCQNTLKTIAKGREITKGKIAASTKQIKLLDQVVALSEDMIDTDVTFVPAAVRIQGVNGNAKMQIINLATSARHVHQQVLDDGKETLRKLDALQAKTDAEITELGQ